MRNLVKAFKESGFVKGLVYTVIGSLSFPGLAIINKLQINGMEKLKKLPGCADIRGLALRAG